MSFQAMAWAVKQKVGNATGKSILLLVANYADENGKCFPSQQTIADESECSKRCVIQWLQKFESLGLLSRTRRYSSSGYRSADFLHLKLGAVNSHERRSVPSCATFTPEPINEPITSSLRSDASSGGDKPSLVDEALASYSELAARCGLPAVRFFDRARRRKLFRLLNVHGLPVWQEALMKIEKSDFCRGLKGEFRADLDFLLQPQSFTRLLEGRYDNSLRSKSPGPPAISSPYENDRLNMWINEYQKLME